MESKPTPSILTSNPFEIFTTPFARYHLFRKIIDANSPLSHESENRVLATLKFHQELMDDLSAKESRQLLAKARNVTVEPWPLPESDASGEEIDEEALKASLKILGNSSPSMVTSSPSLLKGTTSVPLSSLPAFSVGFPSFPLVGALSTSLMSAPMCFSDSICVNPLPATVSAPVLGSASICASESVSLPVSVPYVPSLFVSKSVPDLSVSQFREFHIRDVTHFVDQHGEPVSGSGLSIPVSVSAPSVSVCGVSFAGTESVSAAPSAQEKSPVIPASKRKIDDSDEVVVVSETRAKKKYAPSVSVRMTRSKTSSMLPKSELPKSTPKIAPASTKKIKGKNFSTRVAQFGFAPSSSTARPVPLPPPAVVMHRQMAGSIEASLALLRSSIAAQQDAAASLERTLLDHYREIARLETRHAAILASQARTIVSAEGYKLASKL
nr:uncharacterized protein LOC109168966 [Ipomoea trifida]